MQCPDASRVAGGGAGIAVIPQGSYDAERTKILNRLFTNCDNYTWYFERGNYFFDVFDPDAADSDPAKHSLVFDNRSSDWVFGPDVSDARPGLPCRGSPTTSASATPPTTASTSHCRRAPGCTTRRAVSSSVA